jgi:hypothetical protein
MLYSPAIAVGREVFRADAGAFVEILIRIQSTLSTFSRITKFQCRRRGLGPTDSPVDPSDTMLPHYLIATWAKVCQAMGPEFEPYLPVVMPPLFRAANAKADVSVYGS